MSSTPLGLRFPIEHTIEKKGADHGEEARLTLTAH